MPRIIAFTSPKGGCGATFISSALWHTISRNSRKVLAVDMGFQGGTLDFGLGFQSDYIYTLSDVINGDCTLREATCGEDSGFIRADYEEDEFYDFDKALDILASSDYDYIIADVSPHSTRAVSKLAAVSDCFVLVTDCAPSSVRLTSGFAESLDGPDNKLVVANKIVPNYIRDEIHLTIDEVLDTIGYPLLGLVPWYDRAEFITTGCLDKIDTSSVIDGVFSRIFKRLEGESASACDISEFFRTGSSYKYFMKGRK